MKDLFFKNNQKAMLFFLWLSVVGLFLTENFRALLSIAMIGFTLVGLLSAKPKFWFHNIKNNKPLLFLIGSFLVVLPSVIYSKNLSYFGLRAQILIPFLVMPFAYAQVKTFSDKFRIIISLSFIFGVFITSIQALIYYYFNQAEVNQAYLESRVMPAIVSHHPTFSLMCAFAIYLLYDFLKTLNKKIFQILILLVAVFLIIFLHIFSVRIGIIAFYGLVLLVLYEQIIIKKQYFIGLLILFTSLLIAFFTYNYSPTIKNKIANTQNDIDNYKSGGSANNQSLGSRLISYKNAIEITENSSWLIGCGLGDVEDLNNEIYKTKYPDITKKIIPHNQFLYYLASIGMIGVLIFAFCFYFPVFKQLNNFKLLAFYLVISLAFLVEAFLTTQLGVGFTIIFILLFTNKGLKTY
ncbi:MAG: O-antigen ligase family protein [Bacteroidota bacterium]